MSDLDYLHERDSTADLVEVEGTKYAIGHDIYEILKSQLSSSEMESLKAKQTEWIEHRDKIANDTSVEVGGDDSMTGAI